MRPTLFQPTLFYIATLITGSHVIHICPFENTRANHFYVVYMR